ncbi:MAG TPA: hypothetical protein VLX29_11590, partial [Nitrospirota bacterium]|nr:hypothetical protein [Nitrospirota bacterium]
MNRKYTLTTVYFLLIAFMCACFVQVVSAAPLKDSFTVNFPDLAIIYHSGMNQVMIGPRGMAVSYPSMEVTQIGPGLYHMRHKAWKNSFWKIETGTNKIYRVTNGSFGKEGGTAKNMGNIHVITSSMQKAQEPIVIINLYFDHCMLTYDPKTDNLRFTVEGDEISTRSDWEIKQIDDNMYTLKCKLFNSAFNLFWKIDLLNKKIFLASNASNYAALGIHPPMSPINNGSSGINAQPKSDWIESEKVFNRELLKRDPYDVLVVPFQVQGYALDRIGRSLMTRFLVDKIESVTDLKIPDPTLVSRSLGELSRTFNDQDVYQLANDLKVKTLIKGYVGHDGEGEMQFKLLIQSRDWEGQLTPSTTIKTFDWKDLPFSDEHLPSEVFHSLLDDVISRLQLKQTKKPAIGYYKETNVPMPDSVSDMVSSKTETPVVAAYYLQLLGSLFPEETASREYLFERSLVALSHISQRSPDYALLKARAYFYLYRRPAALAVLKTPSTPEEKAFVALLNGNLVELKKLVTDIKKPIPRLLAQVELNDLQWSYHDDTEAKASYKKIIRDIPNWDMLVTRRLQSIDPWSMQSNLVIKAVLDEFFPLPDFTAKGLTLTNKALGEYPFQSENIDFSVFNHYRRYLTEQGRKITSNESWSPVKYDVLDLLAAIGESNLIKNVRLRVFTQALYQEGIALLDTYERIYQGHPEMAYLRAEALMMMAGGKQGQVNVNMIKKANTLKFNACYWFQGQTHEGSDMCSSTLSFYDNDYPQRWYWYPYSSQLTPAIGLNSIATSDYVWKNAAPTLPQKEISDLLRYDRSLRYTHTDMRQLDKYYALLAALSLKQEADELLRKNRNRFIGNPFRTLWFAELEREQDNKEGMKKLYEEAIDATPNVWDPYEKLGSLFIEEGNFKKAAAIFQRYPLFNIPEGDARYNDLDTVDLSNYAASAAFKLWTRGAITESLPFFTLSRGYDTGSASCMRSSARLSLFKENYVQAAREELEIAKRYNMTYDYSYYMQLLHLMGYHQEAWSLFDNVDLTNDLNHLLGASFVGHRMEGRTDEEQLQWLHQRIGKKFSAPDLRQRYLLLTHLVDRAPNKNLPAIMDEIFNETINNASAGKSPSLQVNQLVQKTTVDESKIP